MGNDYAQEIDCRPFEKSGLGLRTEDAFVVRTQPGRERMLGLKVDCVKSPGGEEHGVEDVASFKRAVAAAQRGGGSTFTVVASAPRPKWGYKGTALHAACEAGDAERGPV